MWFAVYMTGMIASLIASVYYSTTARQRGLHPLQSRMILGKMNVSLGVLVLLFGINQFTFADLSSLRIAVGIVLLFVGAVNLIFGLRNFFRYRQQWQNAAKNES
ncbi:YtpI family protein [Brevibacillus fulvus]|uniref:YtpI-like protein n=1 Tax=Brevibacillus fulvus TaxID=1125967 RepID=A0A939BTA1_9BACL|nr:YtpI family protein [Brevibacillus fulvus]MBM7591303.1 hypothetical protein [Brevibacillus fulvus]